MNFPAKPSALNRRRVLGALMAGTGMAITGCASRGAPPDLPLLPALGRKSVSRLRWSRSVGYAGIGFVPKLLNDSVLVAARDGSLTQLAAATGSVKKTWSVGSELTAGVGSNGQVHAVADTEGRLIAIDADGENRWSIDMGAEAASLPTVTDSLVLVRQSNSAIVAYGLGDGSRRWLYTRRNPTLVLRQTTAIAIDEQAAYVGLPGGRLVALSLQTGATLWEAGVSVPRGSNEIERIADVVAAPVVSGNSVCAAAYQGRVTCLDKASGRNLWSEKLQADSGVQLDDERIYCANVDGKIMAYSRTGKRLWEQSALRGRRLSALRVAHGYLWIGDANGFVHSLDLTTGDLTGRVSTDGSQLVAAPLAGELDGLPAVVVQTTAGTVAAIVV